MTPRAPSLPPDERRAEIVRAARPLLLELGGSFTTKQVAEAAGIAEGTLFRVFPTKRDLMQAVIADAMDTTVIVRDLDAIDRTAGLETRVMLTVGRLQRSIDEVSAVFAALFQIPSPEADELRHKPKEHTPEGQALHEARAQELHAAIVRVLETDAQRLTCSPEEAASLVRGMAFATSHPHISDRRLTDAARIAQLLLHGMTKEDPC
ncbi:TetR family transcriptional regulator [Luteococcus japonicus]|uniref:TetR family transcriptional regulator n=1 Tax=Luteococcus japonicus TaxID=33984 RepID=A0A3N1ZWP3_9ACTN|nr:TetR family transcriptional regulator [Luteococcus japonicus]